MSLSVRLNNLLGIRSQEAQTVRLFFLHHFFLGIGTMLVYVAANVILLENNPEDSLPIAYVSSALGMIVLGKLYEHFEHHWVLSKLVIRVLVAVLILTLLVVLLVLIGNSVVFAVAIMVAFRGIYLLTNLEFWGVSAVVFDVRQSKRLFSVISSGDMPAKALGAILVAFIHHHSELVFVLLIAFGFFLAALFTVHLTIKSHTVHASHRSVRSHAPTQTRLVRELFGGSKLVYAICLSLFAVAAVGSSIEYAFFVNVKHRFHDQSEVIQTLGYVLALTYLLAMLVKLIVSQQALDRFGILASLRSLPFASLLGIIGFCVLLALFNDEHSRMVYFCALYLIFEVVRRAIFDPIFLVLFQPLSPQQRLHGHTLAKAFYEPIGIGMAGLLIFVIHAIIQQAGDWLLLAWVVFFSGMGLFLLGKVFKHYLLTLKEALARRFIADENLAMPEEALQLIIKNLQSPKTEEALNALEWLGLHKPSALNTYQTLLLAHKTARIRLRTLELFDQFHQPIPANELLQRIETDSETPIRELAARLYCQRYSSNQDTINLLTNNDLAIQKGAIAGCMIADRTRVHHQAQEQLDLLCNSAYTEQKKTALELISFLRLSNRSGFLEECLKSNDPLLIKAAIEAEGAVPNQAILTLLINFLKERGYWQAASRSLVYHGTLAIAPLHEMVLVSDDVVFVKRVVGVCQKMESFEAYELLVALAQRQHLFIRQAALESLLTFPTDHEKANIFEDLLKYELEFAQRLIHGEDTLPLAVQECMDYEHQLCVRRILLILSQLYDKVTIGNVLTSITNNAHDRQANSLELLDNLIPRTIYVCLQTLVEELSSEHKKKVLINQFGDFKPETSLLQFIVWRGDNFFSDWTLSIAIKQAFHDKLAILHLPQYLYHPNPLLKESVKEALQELQRKQPTLFAPLQRNHPTISSEMMNHSAALTTISLAERVIVLKNTSLFSETPESVLSSVVPIMKEVHYHREDVIFKKGDIGNCMFVIYAGEVAVFDGVKKLASFTKGDVFGELALLDTEARSATAVAMSELLVFRIDQDDFYDLMEERSEVLRNIVRMLCQRIRNLNTKLVAL